MPDSSPSTSGTLAGGDSLQSEVATTASPRTPTESKRKSPLWLVGVCVVAIAIVVCWRIAWRDSQRTSSRLQQLRVACDQAYEEEDWHTLDELTSEWVSLAPKSADAWILRADAARGLNEFDRMIECLYRVPEENETKWTRALNAAADQQFGQMNRPHDGAETCRKILARFPRHAEARRKLIFYYALTVQRRELIAEIREAIRYACEPPEAYVYLMTCDHLSFTNGYTLNNRWLRGTPDSEQLIVARAIQMDDLLSNLENKDRESEEQKTARLQQMQQYQETYADNAALLAYSLRRATAEANVERVARLLQQIPASADNDSLFWRYRGWSAAARGDLEAAETAYRKSLGLFSLDWHAWNGLAGVLRRRGQLELAEEAQKTALVGKELRKQMMQLPDARQVTPALLNEMATYAEMCGDELVVKGLQARAEGVRF